MAGAFSQFKRELDGDIAMNSKREIKDGFAYSQALAFESLELREKFDQDKKEFNGVTFDDIERYAKIVAYKVANNLKNGFVMDNNDDPLNYGNE